MKKETISMCDTRYTGNISGELVGNQWVREVAGGYSPLDVREGHSWRGEIRIEISSMGRCQSQEAQERAFWAEEMSRAKTLRMETGLAHSKNRKSPGSLGLWLSEQGGDLWKSQQAVRKHMSLALGTAGEN